jgi:hypothetical protein
MLVMSARNNENEGEEKMGDWGTLTDYATGDAIRPATEEEWQQSIEAQTGGGPGGYTGAFRDEA